MKKNLLAFVFLGLSLSLYSQKNLEIGSVLQESKITTFNSQNLILIDFWATWCAPCIPAAEQLEVYQQQLKNDIYMIGISDENEFKIKRFLEKYDMKMAIYQDYNFSNVRKFDVKYRPYSVILNNKGKVVWSGSPSDLNVEFIKKLSNRENQKTYSLSDIFEYKKTNEISHLTEIDTLDIYSEIKSKEIYENQFVKTSTRVYYEGDIIGFFSHLLGKPKTIFNSEMDLNINFGSRLNIWEYDKNRVLDYIKTKFQVEHENTSKEAFSNVLKIDNPKLLWDKNQIKWSNDGSSNYIIGDSRIEADNLTIKEICNILSDVKNKPYSYTGNNTEVYDWNFHYLYDNLMTDELKYQFGIEIIEGEKKEIEIINIKKSNL